MAVREASFIPNLHGLNYGEGMRALPTENMPDAIAEYESGDLGHYPLSQKWGVSKHRLRDELIRRGTFRSVRDANRAAMSRGQQTRRAQKPAGWQPKICRTPIEQRDYMLRRRYGITLAEYEQLLKVQGNTCAICSKPGGDTKGTRLNVDHDHSVGHVRGLLCSRCNQQLGTLEQHRWVMSAMHYLMRTGSMVPLVSPAQLNSDSEDGCYPDIPT